MASLQGIQPLEDQAGQIDQNNNLISSTAKEMRILLLKKQSYQSWNLQALCFFLPPFGLWADIWVLLILKQQQLIFMIRRKSVPE